MNLLRPLTLALVALAAGVALHAQPVTGTQARHHEGQTILTWNETPTVASTIPEAMTMDEARALRTSHQTTSYRIYRSTTPITSVAGFSPIKTVGALSGWNTEFYGRENNNSHTGASFRYVVDRETGDTSAVRLARDSAVCAYNPPTAGTVYYAVTVVRNGIEDTTLGSGSTVQVAETVGDGVPILQSVETRTNWYYTTGTSTHYFFTRWESPPRSNTHGRAIDYMVVVPAKYNPANPMPAVISFHGWGGNMQGMSWWFNFDAGTIVVTSNQEPYDWWTGYHELSGLVTRSQANWQGGVVRPYTQNRVNAFFDFVATRWNVDRSRTILSGVSMGGSGSIMYSLRQADRVAWCNSWVGVHIPAESPTFLSSYVGSYGDLAWNLLFEDGVTPAFSWFDDDWYLRHHIAQDTPFVTFSNGKNDSAIGWSQAAKFARALQETKRPHIFHWGQSGHGERALCPPNIDGLRLQDTNPIDIRTDQTLPAFTRCSLDGNPGNGDPADGDASGQINAFLFWRTSDIVDTEREWAMTVGLVQTAPATSCTVSLTPRRLQHLVVAPGAAFRWTNTAFATGTVVQSGTAIADADGLLTIEGLALSLITRAGGGNRIALAAVGETFESGLAPARELHVATTGNDATGNGSPGAPFRTIAHAVALATPGTAVRIHAGTYPGNLYLSDVAGSAGTPIWIGGVPGEARPVLSGGGEGLHLTRPRYVVVHDLEITGASSNGVNCDDGGDYDNPEAARHVVFRHLRIHHIGTGGNQDGLKLSGVNDYFILDCEIADGSSGGSGIDHVGCHRGLIARNRFTRAGTNAVQSKGGSSAIEIRANWFEECGARTLNIGGSTGYEFFRPALAAPPAVNYEARDVRVVANVFIGSDAPLAFVGAVDCVAVNNTIVSPHNWVARILQETVSTATYTFAPCGNNTVANNIVHYDRGDLSTFVNVGSNTAAATFTFNHNLWVNTANPAQSTPSLPVAETSGLYGTDPLFVSALLGDYRLRTGSPALAAGAAHPLSTTDFLGDTYAAPPALGAFALPAADYAAWRAANWVGADLTDDVVSGPLADPDRAGVKNLVRYACDLPARGSVVNPITLGTTTLGSDTFLTLTFPRRTAASDLSYCIESSTDLVTWTAVPGRTYTAGSGPITAQDAIAIGSTNTPRRFLRLRVTNGP